MKSSDYLVSLLKQNGIKDVFGYQGTMIAHFVDSLYKIDGITNHMCYNEQGAAFAAVGHAKTTGKCAVAFATSGPGAMNLLSGVADAYYDSAPVVFITGQLNSYEYTGISELRQQGFQEADVVSMAKPVTKYAVQVTDIADLRYEFEKAFYIASEGRKGPVLIDLPMDLQRQEIEPNELRGFVPEEKSPGCKNCYTSAAETILDALKQAKRPLVLLGNGIVKGSATHQKTLELVRTLGIPVITSMPARHLFDYDDELNFGFLGAAYGHRYTNILAYKKADLIVSLSCSFCRRQTGAKSENFAKSAKIIRVDVDKTELLRKVHSDETAFNLDYDVLVDYLLSSAQNLGKQDWLTYAKDIRAKLNDFDNSCKEREPNFYLDAISEFCDKDTVVCCDVGQHQIWTAQSLKVKDGCKVLYSGGHGAMGFSLPAAIGAHYASGKNTVAICGDGAMQMNIQELQWLCREQLPVTVFVLNNSSLGLIQQQQDDFFGGNHFGSVEEGGYDTPDFCEVAKAYKLNAYKVNNLDELKTVISSIDKSKPNVVEVILDVASKAYPKTYFGEEMYNQKPYISEELMKEILDF